MYVYLESELCLGGDARIPKSVEHTLENLLSRKLATSSGSSG